MPFYESVFIARQDVSATQVEGLAETFDKVIKDQGGTVTKTESWGLRSLAYRIKKNRKGYYVLLNIDAPAPAILEMERQMRLNEDIIRYLTTRVDALEEGPSAVMRNKERGDDRGRRGGRDDRRPRDRDRDRGRDGKRDRDETKDAKPAAKKDAEKDSAEDAEKAADKDAAKAADKAADKDAAKGADKDAAKAADKADDKGAEKTAKKAAKDEGGEE